VSLGKSQNLQLHTLDRNEAAAFGKAWVWCFADTAR
jgi:hypothetical protein